MSSKHPLFVTRHWGAGTRSIRSRYFVVPCGLNNRASQKWWHLPSPPTPNLARTASSQALSVQVELILQQLPVYALLRSFLAHNHHGKPLCRCSGIATAWKCESVRLRMMDVSVNVSPFDRGADTTMNWLEVSFRMLYAANAPR